MAALTITEQFKTDSDAVVYAGDCIKFLRTLPSASMQMVVTSPPYNIGKPYEKRLHLDDYLAQQSEVIEQCVRVLKPSGSLCWQVGNYVNDGEIVPLDIALYPIFRQSGLKMRNRIVWRFEHGLHCSRRLSGRYETINWFTKSDDYVFHLDPIRVPQKYPGKKHFKGPKAGQLSCNPLGKNPGDVWEIPNVKNNHVEKTEHPCQFPVELIERLVLALTNPGDWVLDPFLGAGTSVVAAVKHLRRGAGAEIVPKYADIALARLRQLQTGSLRTRPMNRPVYDPTQFPSKLTINPWAVEPNRDQMRLLEPRPKYRVARVNGL